MSHLLGPRRFATARRIRTPPTHLSTPQNEADGQSQEPVFNEQRGSHSASVISPLPAIRVIRPAGMIMRPQMTTASAKPTTAMAMVVPSATAAVSSSLKTKETSESRFRDAICLNTVHCDTLLSALFLDEDLKDVVFEFDPPVGDEEPLSENDESMDKEKATMGLTSDNGQASGTTANGGKRAVGIPAIKAHSLILSQYNSFKTLLSSTSEEQERTGIRAIHIKDADNRSFKAMVEYIYLGRLTSENEPECLVREDKLASGLTWEGLFLVANQYGIKGLQLVAEDHLHGVKGKSALSFLFRTAYRFESLRSSMIQSVASNGDMLSKRHELKCYFDHPECGPIFADIMAESFRQRCQAS